MSHTIGSTRTTRTLLAGLVIGGVVLAASLGAAAPASAAPTCVGTGVATACTVVYGFTGAEQQFVVPAGMTYVVAQLVGAGGGNHFSGNPGGEGAKVTHAFTVVPATTLYLEVGGQGANWTLASTSAGGFNGGGASIGYFGPPGTYDLTGGGGGGASDVRTVASANPGSLASRLAIAAGAGGGADSSAGGNGGMPGAGSVSYPGAGGKAGGTRAGGAGGLGGSGGGTDGNPGTLGIGGDGDSSAGGGGGGGLYGGGGAGTYGGGGGGSSLGTVTGVTADAASITLTYSAEGPAVTAPTSADPQLPITGVDPTLPLTGGVLALLAGLAVLFARRRRTAR